MDGRIYIAAAAFLWGTIGVATKVALAAGAGPGSIGAFRALISALLALAVLRERVLDRNLAVMGLLFTGPLFLTYMFSVMVSGMAVAAVMLYTAPAIVIVLAYLLLGERMTCRRVLALVLSGSGVIMTQLPGIGGFNLEGVLFGMGSSLAYSGIILMAKKLMTSGYSALEVGLGPQPWSALELVPFLISERYSINPSFVASVLYLGIFTSFVAYYLHARGIGKVEAGTAGIVSNVEPASAVMIGVLMGEDVGLTGLLGSALVIAGAAMAG